MRSLPINMRCELKSPFGRLLNNDDIARDLIEDLKIGNLLITCGDKTTLKIKNLNININMAIVDGKTKRVKIENGEDLMNICKRTIYIDNEAGTISDDLVLVVKQQLMILEQDPEDTVMLYINGEEDLAFIPCGIFSPDNTLILYGQPDEGLVVAQVDSEFREKITNIYDRMEITH